MGNQRCLVQVRNFFSYRADRIARNLRALVYECERNRTPEVIPVFERLVGLGAFG